MTRLKNSLIYAYFFVALLLATGTAAAGELHLPLLWTTNLNTLLESAPTVADINADGVDEIVVAGREELIAVGKKGKQLWRWRTRGRYMTYPAILTRSGKTALIYAADTKGLLTCLDGSGKVVWQADLKAGAEWSASVIVDLDKDGALEVIQTDSKGTVWAFDAESGAVRWQTNVSGKPVSPAAGDLDGDGNQELVVMSNDGVLYALDEDGTILWKFVVGPHSETWATSAPVIFAASDGTAKVAAASSDGLLFCLDANGEQQWSYPTGSPVASTLSVGDFDLDGLADIFLITQSGTVYRFTENGELLWNINMQGRSLAAGALVDINNDQHLEYLLCTQRGHLLAYDQQGEEIFEQQFDNRTINVTPTFGQVVPKSKELEMIITGGESGKVFCFSTPAKVTTIKQWPSYRQNASNTGTWMNLAQSDAVRMVPQNLAWNRLLVGEGIRFRITNPTGEMIKATAACIRPDGGKLKGSTRVLGTQGTLTLQVPFETPGVYRFSWTLQDSNGKALFYGNREVSLIPFANDRALVEKSIQSLSATAKQTEATLPSSARALRKKLSDLRIRASELVSCQNSIPRAEAVKAKNSLEQTAALVGDAKRILKICNVVKKAVELGPGTSLIAFQGKKWENRDVDNQVPPAAQNPLNLSYAVVPGEHQPVPLMLFNITDHLLTVQVQIESTSAVKVMPMHSVNTPTSLGEESWDALPELDESNVIIIPSLTSRELWLDLQIADSASGHQNMTIKLLALNGAGVLDGPKNPLAVPPPETTVNITLDVLPFQMVPAGNFRLCTWSPSKGPELQDLLAHGNNVFLIHHAKLTYENGSLSDVDFSDIDEIVQQLKGYDVMYLINGMPAIEGDFGGETYRKNLADYLNRLTTHLAEVGVDVDHFALYPIDEPGGAGWNSVNRLVRFGQMVKETAPGVKLYVDGGGELPMIEAMASSIDIWTPPIEWLPESIPEMQAMRNTGKTLWSYNCSYATARPIGPNIKNINLIGEFRTAALSAFRYGVTGIGYWSYNAGRNNPWGRITLEYNLVYPGQTKPVDSRRWEAVREGIEDYRILAALRNLKNSSEVPAATAKRIDKLLKVSLPALVDPGNQVRKLGLAREVIDEVNSEEKMDAFRNEMLECVRTVSGR